MKKKPLTPNQKRLLSMMDGRNDISVRDIENGLQCSYLKAYELLSWLVREKVVPSDLPRKINDSNLKKLRNKS